MLLAGWRRVKANAGAAGVDGITIEELAADAQVEAAWLAALREELHRKTLKLIKAWLRAPIMEEEEGGGRKMKANACGTPQGAVISPLLANIYLHPLDEGVNECRQKPRLIRYADDLVILCRPGEGRGMKERLGPLAAKPRAGSPWS